MTVRALHGGEVTTPDPEALRLQHALGCMDAADRGWPDEYGPWLDEVAALRKLAFERRGYVDVRGLPMTPYDLDRLLEEARASPAYVVQDSLVMCARYPRCCHVFPRSHTACPAGHPQHLRSLQ